MEQLQDITLINADCMDVMKTLPDKAFDLAICDPPYGKKPMRDAGNFGVAKRNFESGSDKWDIKPPKEYFDELFRVSKNQIIWGGNYFIDYLRPTNCFLVWDKNKAFDAYSDCELAWTSFNLPARIFKYTWNGMLQENMKHKEVRIHPTQKPVNLYAWIINNFCSPGNTILDTHLGSGSICIAAHALGYKLTGIELDEKYFLAAKRRLQYYQAQGKLF